MTLNEYQDASATTAVYPETGSGSSVALSYCALGLGEAGEVQNKVKKILRGDTSIVEARPEIIKELGDLLWYIAALARELGYTLEEVCCLNLIKISDRKLREALKGSGDYR